MEEEEEWRRRRRRLSLFVSVTNEDPPNAHPAQHRPVQATNAMSMRRRLSLLLMHPEEHPLDEPLAQLVSPS